MKKILQNIPYSLLILFSVVLGLAPFRPQPHLVEKIEMLFHGTLSRPIDVFDLALHGAPLLLLVAKVLISLKERKPF